MINLTLNDPTQKQLEDRIKNTEQLISKVLSILNNSEKVAKIYTMPDLGFSAIVERMLGGFFNGMCITWDTDIPFIPVDAQIKACGAAVFELSECISPDEFSFRIDKAYKNICKYIWDYNFSNHFVLLTYDINTNKQYLVLHSSAKEFQIDITKALIPTPGIWFENDIQTYNDFGNNYFLRYIYGNIAERFYKIAKLQNDFIINKNRKFAELVLENNLKQEITNLSHYGMPCDNMICIGCHWEDAVFPLLTSPGRDIFVLRPNKESIRLHNAEKKYVLSPHGLGLEFKEQDTSIFFNKDNIEFKGEKYYIGHIMDIDNEVLIRGEKQDLMTYIQKILYKTPADVILQLKQICCYSKRGIQKFIEN